MSLNKVSQNTKNAILKKSAFALPNRPSAEGMKPDEIKKAFYQPILDATNSALAEIDRLVDELNIELEDINYSTSAHAENYNNPHNVTKEQVGLGNVDNTSDINKPISNLQQEELDKKINIVDIQDNLSSTDNDKPVSALQAKLLKDNIDAINSKLDLSIKSLEFNSENGVITITTNNNTTSEIDLPTEFLVKSGYLDEENSAIVLVFDNKQKISIPVNALFNYYYADNATLSLYTNESTGKLNFKLNDAYKNKIDENTTARHTHTNKNLLDTYNQTNADLTDAVSKKHSHSNMNLLNTYDQTNEDIKKAINNNHIHSNKSILDNTTSPFTTELAGKISENETNISDINSKIDDMLISINKKAEITLNNVKTTKPSFYAPTQSGTNGYFLKSNGIGKEPTWEEFTNDNINIDDALSDSSTNPVQNKIIKQALTQFSNELKSYADNLIKGVINGADDAFDTLKELQDWITSSGAEVDALIARISDIENDIDTLQSDKANKTDSISQFVQDGNHRTVTDDEKTFWNNKSSIIYQDYELAGNIIQNGIIIFE